MSRAHVVFFLLMYYYRLMPSQLHDVLVQFFRNRPELAPTLLREALGVALPSYTEARIESATLTNVLPAEYRADMVVLLIDGKPVLGIVIEVQLQPDEQKRYSWPAYVAGLRARFHCPCCLLVVTVDNGTARWASAPIDLGPGGSLSPLVLGPEGVPIVSDPDKAKKYPELAVMSVMAHGRGDVQTAVNLAALAAQATQGLDADMHALYLDLIESALGEAARKAFEMIPETYKFQGPTYLKAHAKGLAEGRTEGQALGQALGEAQAVITVLEARGLAPTEQQRQRILACTDLEQLNTWVRKAVTLADVEELFAQ